MTTDTEVLERINKNFFSIEIAKIIPDSIILFDIYIHLPVNMKFFHYIRKGNSLSKDKIEKFSKNCVSKLYVPNSQQQDFNRYVKSNNELDEQSLNNVIVEGTSSLRFHSIEDTLGKYAEKVKGFGEKECYKRISNVTLHIKDEITRVMDNLKKDNYTGKKIKDTTLQIRDDILKIKSLSDVVDEQNKPELGDISKKIEEFVDYIEKLPENSQKEMNDIFKAIAENTMDLTLTDEGKQIAGNIVEQQIIPLMSSIRARLVENSSIIDYDQIRKEIEKAHESMIEISVKSKTSNDNFFVKKVESLIKMFEEIKMMLSLLINEINTKEEKISKLEGQIIKYENVRSSNKSKNEDVVTNEEVSYQLYLMKTENEELKKKNEFVVSEYKIIEENMFVVQKRNTELEKEVKKINKELESVRSKNEIGKVEEFKEKYNNAVSELKTQESNVKSIQRELEKEKQNSKNLKEEITKLEHGIEEFKDLKAEYGRLTQQMNSEQRKSKKLESENNDLKHQIEKIKKAA